MQGNDLHSESCSNAHKCDNFSSAKRSLLSTCYHWRCLAKLQLVRQLAKSDSSLPPEVRARLEVASARLKLCNLTLEGLWVGYEALLEVLLNVVGPCKVMSVQGTSSLVSLALSQSVGNAFISHQMA